MTQIKGDCTMNSERYHKIKEHIVILIVLMIIFICSVGLYFSFNAVAPEKFEYVPMPIPENGVYDFDELLKWLSERKGSFNSSVKTGLFRIEDRIVVFSEVYVDGAHEDYKGTLYRENEQEKVLYYSQDDDSQEYIQVPYNLYLPIGRSDMEYMLKEHQSGVWSLWRWAHVLDKTQGEEYDLKEIYDQFGRDIELGPISEEEILLLKNPSE